jgi:hypothetical protein
MSMENVTQSIFLVQHAIKDFKNRENQVYLIN